MAFVWIYSRATSRRAQDLLDDLIEQYAFAILPYVLNQDAGLSFKIPNITIARQYIF